MLPPQDDAEFSTLKDGKKNNDHDDFVNTDIGPGEKGSEKPKRVSKMPSANNKPQEEYYDDEYDEEYGQESPNPLNKNGLYK